MGGDAITEPLDSPGGGSDSGADNEQGFMSVIGRLGLGELDQEPKRLAENLKQIDSEIKSLSVKHYDVHIQNAKCLAAVGSGCRDTRLNTEQITKDLPSLADELKKFKKIGLRIADEHSKNMRTLDKHVQLLELLEIPQLMDTCSRNNLFDEALDLSSFASTLQKRHQAISKDVISRHRSSSDEKQDPEKEQIYAGGTRIVDGIAEEVYESATHMRKQLLQQLRQQINLPTCLRIISFLKRLDAQERMRKSLDKGDSASTLKSDEIQLRFEFLDCRDAYIMSLATEDAASYQTRPYKSSLKLIETCRVNWFDVITQYKPIFASGDNILQELDEDGGILARWVSGKMIDFLITLESAISNIEDFGSLSNVLEQAMKFGLSLARVGADFRPLLMEPFKRRVFEIMLDFWQHALNRAETQIVDEEWGSPLPMPKDMTTTKPKSDVVSATTDELLESGEGEEEEAVEQDLTPPNEILEFPVAAELVNVIVTSFNELRQCCSPIFALELGKVLAAEFARLPRGLMTYQSREGNKEEPPERFGKLCRLLSQTVLPYIQLCFDAVFDKGSFSPDLRTFLPIADIQQGILQLVPAQVHEEQREPSPDCHDDANGEMGREEPQSQEEGDELEGEIEDEQDGDQLEGELGREEERQKEEEEFVLEDDEDDIFGD